MTSERLFNSYIPPKTFISQNKFLATPLLLNSIIFNVDLCTCDDADADDDDDDDDMRVYILMFRLNVAASSGFLDIVDLFLKRSCDVNSRDRTGTQTPTCCQHRYCLSHSACLLPREA